MKRDLDLVRKILLALEDHEHGFAPNEFRVEGHTDEEVGFHASLMKQAGLIDAVDMTHGKSPSKTARPRSITWNGYEFLNAARNETIWEKAKSKAQSAGLASMFEVLKDLAVSYAQVAVAT